jgi:prolyl-tRNA synthetase
MKHSHLFTKTRKDAPKDEVAKNAQLLIRAGFIHKEMAGVYSLLPLGLRVVNNLKKVIAEEIEKIGSTELIMSTLQNKEVWEKTDRWDDKKVDIWFKTKINGGNEVGLGWSHEEPVSEMMKSFISSYNDLPRSVYQFQNKLRNEVRAKSGIMRCREFAMKDMYYFAQTDEQNTEYYNKAIEAYLNIFKKIGLGEITFVTSAAGGFFTDKFSHEFQTICDAGEDMVYLNREKNIALNEEIFNEKTLGEMNMKESDFEKVKTAEVGNIFNFGSKKCEEMELYFKDKEGVKNPVHLSSYGIGITRLMGVIAEVLSDENGIIWPESVAPFKAHLLCLAPDDSNVKMLADDIYRELDGNALYDDRENTRGGEKFADADLLGMPWQIIIGKKSHQDAIEVKNRKTGKVESKSMSEIIDMFGGKR